MKTKVYASLLRYGMCNRLFIWAHAEVFASRNKLPVYTNGWYKTPIGPWLRNERTKRFYAFYFKNQTDLPGYFFRQWFASKHILYNPDARLILKDEKYSGIVFNQLPHFNHYFDQLMGYNQFLAHKLDEMISRPIRRRMDMLSRPEIGVHVRKGDFTGNAMTETHSFFKSAIDYLRRIYGTELSVTIFSDGYEEELKELLSITGSVLFRARTDIEELIALSRSRYIVTSLASTYSYWAAFLSDAVIIHSLKYQGTPVRWTSLVKEAEFYLEKPDNLNLSVEAAKVLPN